MRRSLISVLPVALLLASCGGAGEGSSTTSAVDSTVADGGGGSVTTSAASVSTTTEPVSSVEAPELGGTAWNVTDYKLPTGTITNVWKTEVTIAFAADGTVSGSAGCNTYQGTWSVSGDWNEFEDGVPDPEDGQVLAMNALSWTEKACEDAAIMEQEREILDLLQSARRWVLIRGNFNLRDAEGSFLFEAEPG